MWLSLFGVLSALNRRKCGWRIEQKRLGQALHPPVELLPKNRRWTFAPPFTKMAIHVKQLRLATQRLILNFLSFFTLQCVIQIGLWSPRQEPMPNW